MIDFMKYKKVYFALSAVFMAVCVFGIIQWGLVIGVDFKGGSLVEYRFSEDISSQDLTILLQDEGYQISSVQKTSDNGMILKLAPLTAEEKDEITDIITDSSLAGEFEELRFESVGPSVGPELIKKTIYAVLLAASLVLLWIAIQFKDIKFGMSAVLATLHDSFILIGSFSIFGYLYGAEVDFLIITAVLTTLSFSVHDTIVVFDRVREIRDSQGGEPETIANRAISETIVRSLNNSFTLVFMLVAIILLGGETIKWFIVALLVGTIFGAYSSPFVAVPLWLLFNKYLGKK